MAKNRLQLLVKVAEMYHIEGLNQNQIASSIGISRPTISRMLEEAKEEGIVQVTVKAPFHCSNTLMMKLKKKFKLEDVIVVKDVGDYDYNIGNIGKASADFLDALIKKNEEIVLGISWGRAVEELTKTIGQYSLPKSKTVLMNGSLGSNGPRREGGELVYELSRKLGGECIFFNAPAYVDSPELQTLLLQQTQIQETLKIGKEADVFFGGIGNFYSEHNTLLSSGILDKTDLELLQGHGAVGTLMGAPFDQNGSSVQFGRKYPISMSIDDLCNIPVRIGAAVSSVRREAVLGAIRGKLVNVLICDEDLALSLLK